MQQASTALECLNKGNALKDLKKYEEAIVAYEHAIALKPDYALAYNYKGTSFSALTRYEEAIVAYDRAISLQPYDVQAYSNKGMALNALTRYEEALVVCNQAISLKPDYALAYSHKGAALQALSRTAEATFAFAYAISLQPDLNILYNNKGLEFCTFTRYGEAIVAFDRAISLQPLYAEAYNNKGNTLYALSKYEEALAAYDRAISLQPLYAEAYNSKGNALYELSRYEDALEAYDRFIVLGPDNALSHFNKGLALTSLKRYEEALAAYDRAISLQPLYAEAYNNKGNTLYELSRYEEAIKAHDHAVSLKPVYAEAYNSKGKALSLLSRYEEALEAYDHAISLKPDWAEAYNNKGVALNSLTRAEEALVAYEHSISLAPSCAAYHGKGMTLKELNKNEEALAALDCAISLAPDNALCYCNKGKLLHKLGQEAAALECFNKAYNLSKSGYLGKGLNQNHVVYINEIVSQDREALLAKLTALQEVAIETQKVVDTLDVNDPIVKSAVEKFKALKQTKAAITDQVTDSLDDQKVNKDQSIAHADNQFLLELMLQMQAQMLQLQAEVKQLKDRVDIHEIILEDHDSKINLTEEELTKLARDLGVTKQEIKTNKEEFQALANLVASHDYRIKASEDYLAQMGDVTGSFEEIKKQIEQNSKQFTESLDQQNKKIEKLATEVSKIAALSNDVINLADRVNAQEGRLIEVYQRFDEYDKKLISLDRVVEEINANNEAISQLQAEMLANKKLLDQFSDSNKNGKGEFNNDALAELTERLNAKMLEADQNIRLLQEKVLEHETTLEIVSNLVPQIKGLVVREEQSQKAASELEAIYSDPYKESFYEVMRWELNTVYLAAMVVQTDIVKSSKSGSVGKIGKLISSVSSHIPMVGAGVSLLGYILESVDVVHQKTIIARYASLVPDAVEMSTLAKQVSQGLVSNDLIKHSLESSGASTSAFTKFTQILGNIAIEFAQNGLSNVANKISYSEIGSMVSGGVGSKVVISQVKQAMSSSVTCLKGTSAADVTLTIGQVVVDDTIDDLYTQNTANDKPSFKERLKKLNPFKNTKKEEKASEKADNNVQDATKITTEEDHHALLARQEGLKGERDAAEISKFIIAKLFKEGARGGDISSKVNFIVKFVKVEYGVVVEDEMATAISSDLDSLSIGSPVSAASIKLLDTSSKEIATGLITRAKTLLKATNTNSHNDFSDIGNTTEQEFIKEFAKILRTEYRGLLESSNLSEDLRSDLIKQLILGFKNNGTFAVNSGIFEINDSFMFDEDLLTVVIASVKDKVKTKEYIATDGQRIEIRQLSSLTYDNPILNDNKLLSAAWATNSAKVVNDLINLGQDQELAIALTEASQERSPEQVIRLLFEIDPIIDDKAGQVLSDVMTSTDCIVTLEQFESSSLIGES